MLLYFKTKACIQIEYLSIKPIFINLPLANYKKLINFFENEEEVPVKVYFETASEYVNASKFRIDLLLTGDELVADEDKATDQHPLIFHTG